MAQGMLSEMKVCPYLFWRNGMANIDQLTLFDTGENVNRRSRKPDVLKNIEFMDLESIVRQLGNRDDTEGVFHKEDNQSKNGPDRLHPKSDGRYYSGSQ